MTQYIAELSLESNIFPILSQAFVVARLIAQRIEQEENLKYLLLQRRLEFDFEGDLDVLNRYYLDDDFHYIFENWFHEELIPEVLTSLFKLAKFDKSGITFKTSHARQLAYSKIFQ